ncbi:MAG: hypothetical protein ACRBDL_06165 [Alphaproteobacteria bacterium]
MSDEERKKEIEKFKKLMDVLSDGYQKPDMAKLSREEQDKIIREELEAYRKCKREQSGKTIH